MHLYASKYTYDDEKNENNDGMKKRKGWIS